MFIQEYIEKDRLEYSFQKPIGQKAVNCVDASIGNVSLSLFKSWSQGRIKAKMWRGVGLIFYIENKVHYYQEVE